MIGFVDRFAGRIVDCSVGAVSTGHRGSRDAHHGPRGQEALQSAGPQPANPADRCARSPGGSPRGVGEYVAYMIGKSDTYFLVSFFFNLFDHIFYEVFVITLAMFQFSSLYVLQRFCFSFGLRILKETPNDTISCAV